ncbi:hydrolase [Leptospira wolffii]|uniref:Hydrolase n=1 Tax=Leptospira wolffii TaxID=409998 RepID=A0A2M9ZFL3_9LEPT|nr:carbon-nitrogen hydrolase family protein [Leptospira wolffii]PJZ67202.1 hydrolase [Leptospira wolffii]
MRKSVLLLSLLAAGFYGFWCNCDLGNAEEARVLSVDSISYGNSRGKGNLIGVEPYMIPANYSNQEKFLQKTESYFIKAKEEGWLNEKTVMIFPEYYGTWLVVADEKSGVYSASDIQSGLFLLILRHPFRFLADYILSSEKEALQAALFRTKSGSMREIYENTFSYLSRKYGVTILAGSIVLESPVLESGRIASNSKDLYNASFVFGKEGRVLDPPVRKRFLTEEEKPFLNASSSPGVVVPTPAGRMGVLVCADSWYPESYENLRKNGADFIAVPSYINRGESSVWDKPWGGYNGEKNPSDVDLKDIGKISEAQAWKKYALLGRASRLGFQNGINIFLQGKLWDLESDGETFLLQGGRQTVASRPQAVKNAIYNVWL